MLWFGLLTGTIEGSAGMLYIVIGLLITIIVTGIVIATIVFWYKCHVTSSPAGSVSATAMMGISNSIYEERNLCDEYEEIPADKLTSQFNEGKKPTGCHYEHLGRDHCTQNQYDTLLLPEASTLPDRKIGGDTAKDECLYADITN